MRSYLSKDSSAFRSGWVTLQRSLTTRTRASPSHASSMQRLLSGGVRTLKKSHVVKEALARLPTFVTRRNMASSQPKRPVSLLGSMAFGGAADAQQSLDMVKAFLDRGHNQVDTAFMYMDGKSETIIGGMHLPKTGILEAPVLVGISVH